MTPDTVYVQVVQQPVSSGVAMFALFGFAVLIFLILWAATLGVRNEP